MKKIFILILCIFVLNNVFSQDSDLINKAINDGDLETLFNFVNDPEGKDQRLITSANQAIRRYTTNDSATVRYRTNRMDPRVRNVGRELTENVFEDPEKFLPDVVTRITSGLTDPFQRAKVINDWICDNIVYDVETYFNRTNRRQDYVSVLKNKLGVCSGYANLFNQMCRLASIESISISGFSKRTGHNGFISPSPDHDWNAVKINNKWYLIDVTWNAGYLAQSTYIKQYTTNYLFLDSRAFLYTHLPANNKFQFYAPVLTREQFIREPYITGAFFRYQLEIKNEIHEYSNPVNKDGFLVELVRNNTSVELSSALRTTQHANMDGASWQGRSGNTFSFTFDVPDNNNYRGVIFARFSNERNIQDRITINRYEQRVIPMVEELLRDRKITQRERDFFINSYFKVQENGYYYLIEDQFDTARNNALIKIHPLVDLSLELMEPVLEFYLNTSADYAGFSENYKKRYPDTYNNLNRALNTKLISPVNGILKAGTTEKFIIESRDYSGLAIIIGDRFNHFRRNANGAFELEFEIPSGINEIVIYSTNNNRNYEGILRYIVE